MQKESLDSRVLEKARIQLDGLWLRTLGRIYKQTNIPMKYHLMMCIGYMGREDEFTE